LKGIALYIPKRPKSLRGKTIVTILDEPFSHDLNASAWTTFLSAIKAVDEPLIGEPERMRFHQGIKLKSIGDGVDND
jgi:hypothetical protein